MAGGPLAQAWREKYPGAYDHVPDAELEDAIIAKYPGAYDHLRTSDTAEAPAAVHPHLRVGRAAVDTLKATGELAWKASGIPGLFREGTYGAIKDQRDVVGGFLQAQFDQYKKAKEAEKAGRWSEMIGHSVAAALPVVGPMAAHAGERIAAGEVPELIGEVGAGVLMGEAVPMVRGARGAAQEFKQARAVRAVEKAKAVGARTEGDLLMAIPPSKSAPWTVEDLRSAKPYFNEQAATKPIDTPVRLREAADGAIDTIEGVVGGLVREFPEARLTVDYKEALTGAFKDHPRAGALEIGLKELDDLGLDTPKTLAELDRIRRQMNAENKANLKKNNYDRATARQADPAFAAREALADKLRDTLYGYFESRGVEGVRQLRRDEGAIARIRDAANRQEFSGTKVAQGQGETSLARKAAAELVAKGSTAIGAGIGGPIGAVGGAQVGETLGGIIKGGKLTRDQLIQRAFSTIDEARPTYPKAPAKRPIAGYLPESKKQIAELSAVDTSGPIAPTLPENITKAGGDEFFGTAPVGAAAPSAERTFLLRWLADDLREMSYQPGSRMSRADRLQAWQEAPTSEAFNKATYTPVVAGTPTQRMFHALGIKGSRAEIAETIERVVRGDKSKATSKLEALSDAMREAWDGKRFDWSEVTDETMARLGIARKDLESPMSKPFPDDLPTVHERFFPTSQADDLPEVVVRDPEVVASEKAAGEALSASYAEQQVKDLVAERLGISPDRLIMPSAEWKPIRAAAESGDWETAARLVKGGDLVIGKVVRPQIVSKAEMIQRGADGHLSKAYEAEIPIEKLDGLEPVPASDLPGGGYEAGRPVTQPIEVAYDAGTGKYMVYGGNHRIAQAKANGQTTIRAFVEPDGGDIGLPLPTSSAGKVVRSESEVGSALEALAEKYSAQGIDAVARVQKGGDGSVLKLDHLQAKVDSPKGAGSAYMNDLVDLADDLGLTVVLQTAVKGDLSKAGLKVTTSRSRLQDFYRRFGFKPNKGRRPDLSGDMVREPKGKR